VTVTYGGNSVPIQLISNLTVINYPDYQSFIKDLITGIYSKEFVGFEIKILALNNDQVISPNDPLISEIDKIIENSKFE
jgi:hypothetical protein